MTHRSTISAITLILATLALPAAASAAEGWARSSGTLRAGPQSDYPAIARVARGDSLDVYGCLRGRTWCDVSIDGDRGWFPGSRIELAGEGRRIRISDPAAAMFGLSILSFGMADYWGSHYEDRSFYRNDRYWRGHGGRPPNSERPAMGTSRPDRQPAGDAFVRPQRVPPSDQNFVGRRPADPGVRTPRDHGRRDVIPADPAAASASGRPARSETTPRAAPPQMRAPVQRQEAAPPRAQPQRTEPRAQPPRAAPPARQQPAAPAANPPCTDAGRCR
ncbi:hypothetical protein EYW49_04105 [Siculibacillus lacustris]|uniref:SH3b domain-containing protein n=1 Tax=Siculibacillus lacustris TaxID=1549641 RepID=A0A4V2KU84_9HYPH|nr:SH3 domain-containing protein [Siculibacillus lacustris]TBW40375.1 hypothetical protein EYW49_04105 [Siculibacillus lacustris]